MDAKMRGTCRANECRNIVHTRGFCQRHFRQMRAAGKIQIGGPRGPDLNSIWYDPDLVDQVAALARTGLPASKVGHCLGLTKNQIVGHWYRTGSRPVIEKIAEALEAEAAPEPERSPRRRKMRTVAPDTTTSIRLDALNVFPERGHCLWALGHPGESGFHFCGCRVTEVGASYCRDHTAVAYRRIVVGEIIDPWELRKVPPMRVEAAP